MVAQLRQIEYPVRLSKSEFGFLLMMFHAKTVFGLVDESVLPADKVEREQLYAQGQQEMLADHWLIGDDTTGYTIHDMLPIIGVTIASSEVVILTERRINGQQDGVSHYVAGDWVVELSQRDQYELTALDRVETLALRIAHLLGFRDEPVEPLRITVSQQDIEDAKRNPDPAILIQRGISAEEASKFINMVYQPAYTASIKVVRTVLENPIAIEPFGVIVSTNGEAFWATPVDELHVEYQRDTAQGFANKLVASIQQIRTLQPA